MPASKSWHTSRALAQEVTFQGSQSFDAAFDSWPDDSFEGPNRAQKPKLEELNRQVIQSVKNMRAVSDMVNEQGLIMDDAERTVHEAREEMDGGMKELKAASREQGKFLPAAGAGWGASVVGVATVAVAAPMTMCVGGTVGAAAVGACVGGAIGAKIGKVARDQMLRSTEEKTPMDDGKLDSSGSEPSSWRDSAGRSWGPKGYVPFDVVRVAGRATIAGGVF